MTQSYVKMTHSYIKMILHKDETFLHKDDTRKLNISCTSTTVESRAKIWYQLNAFKTPCGLGCCPKAVISLMLSPCLFLL